MLTTVGAFNIDIDVAAVKRVLDGIASLLPEEIARKLCDELLLAGDGLFLQICASPLIPAPDTPNHVIRLSIHGNLKLLAATFGAHQAQGIAAHLRDLGVKFDVKEPIDGETSPA